VSLRLVQSVVMLSFRVRHERHKSEAHREKNCREFHCALHFDEPSHDPLHDGKRRSNLSPG
jgi:hypothetical protein